MENETKSITGKSIGDRTEVINLEVTTYYSGRYNVLTFSQEKHYKRDTKDKNQLNEWLKYVKEQKPSYIDFKFISPITKKNHMDKFIESLEEEIKNYNKLRMQEYQESDTEQ